MVCSHVFLPPREIICMFGKLFSKDKPAGEPRHLHIEDMFLDNSGVIILRYGSKRGRKGKKFTVISDEQFDMGYRGEFAAGERVWMRVGSHFEHVCVASIKGKSALLRISAADGETRLWRGQCRKFSMRKPKLRDLKVTLESVSGDRARLVVQRIEEPVARGK